VLAELVALVRPSRRATDPASTFGEVVEALEEEPELARSLRTRLAGVLGDLRLVYVLIESGIVEDRSIGRVIWTGVGSAILPPVHPAHDARAVVPRVFQRRRDWRWIRAIPIRLWARLFATLLDDADVGSILHEDIVVAVKALAQRIAGTGADQEINGKLAWVDDYESPFLELPIAAHALLEAHRSGQETQAPYEAVRQLTQECGAIVRRLRDEKRIHGTSLRLTRLTRRTLQQLRRFELLVRLVHPRDRTQLAGTLAALLRQLVEAEQDGRRVTRRLGQSVDLLAYQITEHTAAKGAKYIGSTRRAYLRMLAASMGGGAIVGVFAIAKLYAGHLSLSLAAKALLYGLNYAVCFVAIYLTGATLATKQPAITASAIAKQLDDRESPAEGLEAVAQSVVWVWRSQFVSFLGNLLLALPAAVLVGWLCERAWQVDTVTVDRARKLLDANHPWEGPTLFYAAIAGVFLFLAGLIQGAVDNRVVYTRLKERLASHPRLRLLGGLRVRFAKWIAKHAGGLASNVVLGFLLGSAGVVGKILGLPIEIRHIAFSSAHVGVAVLDAPELVNATEIAVLVLGVLGIGFVNFLVSFGLTLAVTLESRGVTIPQGGRLLAILARRLARRPLEWFLPLAPAPGDPEPS